MNEIDSKLNEFYRLRNFYDSQIREILESKRAKRTPRLREMVERELYGFPLDIFRLKTSKGISEEPFLLYLLLLSLPENSQVSVTMLHKEYFSDHGSSTVGQYVKKLKEAGLLKVDGICNGQRRWWTVYVPDESGLRVFKEFNVNAVKP